MFLSNLRLLRVYYAMSQKGYLLENGWVSSIEKRMPVDKGGFPLPWVTLSFIGFIRDRLTNNLSVLEYGSGNSTLFYASRVKSVTSVESNEKWYKKILEKMPENVVLTYVPVDDKERYVNFAQHVKQLFDVVIVDGHSRFDCVKAGRQTLTERGVIVLDNSNRKEYKEIYSYLFTEGFRCLDFWGMAPGSIRTNCTTIFYRDQNCLTI
ncbi:MAG: FkbM family methyltransferase [Cyclobacteriaceae bacterium]